MNDTLNVEKANLLTAYNEANASGKKLLVQIFGDKTFEKSVIERIKTFDDVLQANGLSQLDFDKKYQALTDDEQAYIKIKLIALALNEGWIPDWENSNEPKYYPWFKMGSPSGSGFSYDVYDYWGTLSLAGSRLCFKSSKLAEYAGNTFLDIYKKFNIKTQDEQN